MDHGFDIVVIYSSKSDAPSDSKSPANLDRTVAETSTAAPRGSLDKGLWYETFGSSDGSENSSPGSNRSRSYPYEASVQNEDVRSHNDVDDSPRSHRSHSRDRGASYVGTTQEEQDRDAIPSAPEEQAMDAILERAERVVWFCQWELSDPTL